MCKKLFALVIYYRFVYGIQRTLVVYYDNSSHENNKWGENIINGVTASNTSLTTGLHCGQLGFKDSSAYGYLWSRSRQPLLFEGLMKMPFVVDIIYVAIIWGFQVL